VGHDPRQTNLYEQATREFGRAVDRLAAGYETNPEKRLDLRQDIHLQLWRSFVAFDGRCSLKTWTFRVAHNTAVSYVNRERRDSVLVSLEDIDRAGPSGEPDIDQHRALEHLSRLILQLKPPDRQIMICYLEELDTAAIAEITGFSAANVGMKIHRIKRILARQFVKDQ
jgi:RNA polymerase sigma-70 factor, ECF subfamily